MADTPTNNTFYTNKLTLPTEVLNPMFEKVRARSVIASLVPSQPQEFVNSEYLVFGDTPAAQFVGEGEAKASMPFGVDYVTGKPHKVQVTCRFSDEVRWADEDSQTRILGQLTTEMGYAMGDAVDAGIIHAADPYSRTVMTAVKPESLAYGGANIVEATGDLLKDLDSLADPVIETYDVTGVAFNRSLANSMRKLRNKNTDARLFPDLGMTLDISNYDGLNAVVSSNVAGNKFLPAASPSGFQAIMGKWDAIKWGYVRNFTLQEILYGDPDNTGRDLQGHNEVAYRLEAVISWAVLDFGAFSILKDAEGKDEGGNNNTPSQQSAK